SVEVWRILQNGVAPADENVMRVIVCNMMIAVNASGHGLEPEYVIGQLRGMALRCVITCSEREDGGRGGREQGSFAHACEEAPPRNAALPEVGKGRCCFPVYGDVIQLFDGFANGFPIRHIEPSGFSLPAQTAGQS